MCQHPLMGGVCLREESVSGGLTVIRFDFLGITILLRIMNI